MKTNLNKFRCDCLENLIGSFEMQRIELIKV